MRFLTLSCSLANQTFNMNSRVPSIRMECDGTAVEDLSDYEPEKHSEASSGRFCAGSFQP